MDNDIYLIGDVGYEITLQSVIDMVSNTDKSKTLNVHIHSPGGDLYEGRAIYNYLKNLPQGVDTYAVGVVASAATVFMLAGKNKYAYSQNNVLIHLPMTGMIGNSTEMREKADTLEEEEKKIARIYEQETNLTFDEAMSLMRENRMMTDEEVVKFGLEIKEYKAVARLNTNNMKNENKTEKSFKEQFLALFSDTKIEDKKEETPVNIVEKTAEGKDLEFSERTEGQVQAGDKGLIDGLNADGEVLMASGDTYVFEKGELKEIKEKKEIDVQAMVSEAVEAAIAPFRAESKVKNDKIQALETQISEQNEIFKKLKALSADTVVNTTSNEGKEKTEIKVEASLMPIDKIK